MAAITAICYLSSLMRPRVFLYIAAIFLSSSLLFLVEPMAGKRLLPLLGGSSAVWITCLVFFQTTLLLGYLCAHAIATRLSRRAQLVAYGFLLALSLVQAFANLNPHPHASTVRPVFSVLWVLTMLIGLPFLALSATNPLLQSWYAHGSVSGEKESPAPPYRLFALSNFGSLLALLAYPVLVEPNFSLRTQTLAWSVGFLLFVVTCGVIIAGRRKVPDIAELEQQSSTAAIISESAVPQAAAAAAPSLLPDAVPSPGEKTLWLLMAACGSLLLSAVTSHLSQNIAAIPLLWILPLTIYLLTFVLAFNGKDLLAMVDGAAAGGGAGRGGLFHCQAQRRFADLHFHPAFLPDFIYRSIFLPRRTLLAQAVCALSHAVLSAHCGGRCAGINVCRRARANGLQRKL